MKKTLIYFSPHQDDELLSMGVDICRSILKGFNVDVVLCTDGSSSMSRLKLNDHKKCDFHSGEHIYDLDPDAFSKARDREFISSLHSMGVTDEHIFIYKNRSKDGTLSVPEAEEIIRYYLNGRSEEAVVCTISPNNGKGQHKDHVALGKAAENLFKSKNIQELKLFIEPYEISKIKHDAYLLPAEPISITASKRIQELIINAIEEYSLWDPENERYAIGFHSVRPYFSDFRDKMTNYCYIKKQRNRMTVIDKIDSRYRRWLRKNKQIRLFYSSEQVNEEPELIDAVFFSCEAGNTEGYDRFCKEHNYELRNKDTKRLKDGSSFYALYDPVNRGVISSGWLAYKQNFYISELDYGFDMKRSDAGILYDFRTTPEYRGKGYYGMLLKSIQYSAKHVKRFIIYTSPDNHSSYRGIEKAGFIHDGNFSSASGTIKPYLRSLSFTSFKRKYYLYGMMINHKL